MKEINMTKAICSYPKFRITKANPFPDDGTMHTFPSDPFSEYCLPHFLSAWWETFPLF